MLLTLLAALKDELRGEHAKSIVWNVYCILHILEDQYLKDANAKDATIDCVVQFLQSKKSISTERIEK